MTNQNTGIALYTVQLEKNLTNAVGKNVKRHGKVIGKITEYDKTTGKALIVIDSKLTSKATNHFTP